MAGPTTEPRRARQRRELVAAITAEARSMLAAGGPAAVTWRGIAAAVGLSPASLYTYFPSLHELFTELLLQSYGELAGAVGAALESFAGAPVGDRALIGPLAYRRWALANRAQFNLVFTDQLPGYAAEPDGPTLEAQLAVFRPMAAALDAALGRPPGAASKPGPDLDRFIGWWGLFHGLTTLEVNHHLDWIDATRTYEQQLRRHLEQLGAPRPRRNLVSLFLEA